MRQMTENEIKYLSDIINAVTKNGLSGADITHKAWMLKMSGEENIDQKLSQMYAHDTLERHETAMKKELNHDKEQNIIIEQIGTVIEEGPKTNESILSSEHRSIIKSENISAGEEDLREKERIDESYKSHYPEEETKIVPKKKVLEPTSQSPNIWGDDIKTVSPGHYNNN